MIIYQMVNYVFFRHEMNTYLTSLIFRVPYIGSMFHLAEKKKKTTYYVREYQFTTEEHHILESQWQMFIVELHNDS